CPRLRSTEPRRTGSRRSVPPARQCETVRYCVRFVCHEICPPAFKTFEAGGSGQFFRAIALEQGAAKEAFGAWPRMRPLLLLSACDFSTQTICGFQNCRLWRIASLARANALFEELLLHRVAGQRQRRTEVLARRVVPSAAQLKLAKRRRIKRVAGEAIAVLDRTDHFEAALRTFLLRDRYGAVECHHWRRSHRHQQVVK